MTQEKGNRKNWIKKLSQPLMEKIPSGRSSVRYLFQKIVSFIQPGKIFHASFGVVPLLFTILHNDTHFTIMN